MSGGPFKLESLFGVAGKVVVVSGGGSGLGKAIAHGFATNGATVYITGRRMEVLLAAAAEIMKADSDSDSDSTGRGRVVPVQGDVSTKSGCVAIAAAIQKYEERVDVLVNCAGVSKPFRTPAANPNDPDAVEKMLLSVEDDDFAYTNSINIGGPYFLTSALVGLLRKSISPSVVIIASIAGYAVQRLTGSLTYGVSKAAAIQCGRLLAGRLSPMKIRVNVVCPGIFPSEMNGDPSGTHDYAMDRTTVQAAKRSPLGRAGRPEEIVGPVLMLSSVGGGYMDGAVFVVDGGRLLAAGLDDGIKLDDELYSF